MAKDSDIVHMLLLTDSANDSEHIVSMLRNAGVATRAHHVAGADDLESVLTDKNWDLLIARPKAQSLSGTDVLSRLRKAGQPTPLILLADDGNSDTITQGLQAGANDVVPHGEDERLMLIIKRELASVGNARQLEKARVSLDETDKRCQLLLQSSRDAIAYVADGMHIYANDSYRELFAFEDPDELDCTPLVDLINGEGVATLKERLKKVIGGSSLEEEFECEGIRADETTLPLKVFLSPARYDGESCTQVLLRQASIDETALAEKLKEISSQDQLTGLANRDIFLQRVEALVAGAKHNEDPRAVYYVAIDEFDRTRSEIGISGADALLKQLAGLLQSHTGEGWLLARFADDVFTMLGPDADQDAALKLAESIRAAVEEHLFEIEGRTAKAKLSIGISVADRHAPSGNEVLTRAHTAAERVREGDSKGNGVHFYDPSKESTGNVGAIEKLQRAIENESFKIMFQPIISLRGDDDENYEATMRMLDEDSHEELPPGQFLEIAAEAGLGAKVDRWATLNCVKTLASHRAKGHETHLFINLTWASITDASFVQWVGVLLKSAKLSGDKVVFQFREPEVFKYLKQAQESLKGLKDLGCGISIKHFTGTADSLSIFSHVPADFVKVDGSLTKAMGTTDGKEQLKALVKTLNEEEKTVIVPMVENAQILSTLWQAGVGYIQGYYLQGPTESMDYNFQAEDA